jgi:hypothetical protein
LAASRVAADKGCSAGVVKTEGASLGRRRFQRYGGHREIRRHELSACCNGGLKRFRSVEGARGVAAQDKFLAAFNNFLAAFNKTEAAQSR